MGNTGAIGMGLATTLQKNELELNGIDTGHTVNCTVLKCLNILYRLVSSNMTELCILVA